MTLKAGYPAHRIFRQKSTPTSETQNAEKEVQLKEIKPFLNKEARREIEHVEQLIAEMKRRRWEIYGERYS